MHMMMLVHEAIYMYSEDVTGKTVARMMTDDKVRVTRPSWSHVGSDWGRPSAGTARSPDDLQYRI